MARTLVILAMLVLAARPDAYAEEFPTRPITILIGLAAGGVSDTMARLYADAVSKTLGQRVIVENRATGNGAMAAAALQNAQPDGHTLLIFSGAQHGVVPAIDKTGIYDPIKGNQPVTLLFNTANVLAVPAASPVNSLAEFVEFGKKRTDGLTFGSPGVGSPSHLTGAKIIAATGTPAQVVHYRGGPPMMADLLPGRLDAAVMSLVLARPYLLDKRLKGLAIDAAERWSVIPDVPTLGELGLRDAAVAGWYGVAATHGTPRAIVQKLHEAFTTAARNPDLKRRVEENGLTVVTSTPEEMGQLLVKEVADISQLVHALGLVKQ
jgi:tripartite-type tricarboxylate transporter receptor subunit TctC